MSPSSPSNFQQKLPGLKVLICDPSASFSSTVLQTFVSLGCNVNNIHKESQFTEAVKLMDKIKPDVIVSEYHLENGHGLKLADLYSETVGEKRERVFILISGNISDSFFVESSEDQVDGYLQKPFHLNNLQQTIISVLQAKFNPTPYMKQIERGRIELAAANYEAAVTLFHEARSMDPKPSRACALLGQIYFALGDYEKSLEMFQEGQRHTPYHYNSLRGELSLHLQKKDSLQAYRALKTIAEHYPLDDESLSQLFRLTKETANHEDLDAWYEMYVNLEARPQDLITVVSEALFDGALKFLHGKKITEAVELFRKGAAVAQRDQGYLSKVIKALLKADLVSEAEKFLMFFPPDNRDSVDFLQLEFEIVRRTRSSGEILEKGKKIIDEKKANPDIFKEVVGILAQTNKHLAAEEIIFKCTKTFPDLIKELYSIIENKQAV